MRAQSFEGQDPNVETVGQSMSRDLACCDADHEAAEAEQMMQERKVRRRAVPDREQRLVGIVSLGDLATKHDERCGVAHTLEVISE